MKNFKEYPIFKKRDGQEFKPFGTIWADGFVNAKKKFAQNCAKDLYDEIWLTYLSDNELNNKNYDAGFYVNNSLVWNEDNTINIESSCMECFLSQKAIDKGFTSFREDVYTWELRKK